MNDFLAILTMNPTHLELWAKISEEGRWIHKQSASADGITLVAKAGAVQDWACYWGPMYNHPEEIARSGIKLNASAARLLFPYLQDLHYRD